jgi:hypothetical protein
MALGVALRVWSKHGFGKELFKEVSIDADQELIQETVPTDGSGIRPIQDCCLCFLFGARLSFVAASCVIVAMLLPCIVYRIRVEERAPCRISVSLQRYCKTTWRLIPIYVNSK